MMLLVKLPVPVPSEECELDVVRFGDVPQQTPRAVMASFPSDVMVPPPDADVAVMDEIAPVEIAGKLLHASHGPPQSTPVSPWFCIPSVQVGAGVLSSLFLLQLEKVIAIRKTERNNFAFIALF